MRKVTAVARFVLSLNPLQRLIAQKINDVHGERLYAKKLKKNYADQL